MAKNKILFYGILLFLLNSTLIAKNNSKEVPISSLMKYELTTAPNNEKVNLLSNQLRSQNNSIPTYNISKSIYFCDPNLETCNNNTPSLETFIVPNEKYPWRE